MNLQHILPTLNDFKSKTFQLQRSKFYWEIKLQHKPCQHRSGLKILNFKLKIHQLKTISWEYKWFQIKKLLNYKVVDRVENFDKFVFVCVYMKKLLITLDITIYRDKTS